MPIPWKQVASSPAYLALHPQEREAARLQYFHEVVAPQVDPAQLPAVKAQFDTQTAGTGFHNSVGRIPKPNPNAVGANPTEGMDGGQLFDAGLGKALVDTYRGAQQMGGQLADRFDGGHRADAPTALVNQSRQGDAPLMNTRQGIAGNITGQAAMMAAPIPGAAELKGAQWLGKAAPVVADAFRAGTFGGLQGVADGESRLQNTAVNAGAAAAGHALPAIAGNFAQRAAAKMQTERQALIQHAQEIGIPLSAAQRAQNPMVRTILDQASRMPLAGGQATAARTRAAFNDKVAQEFGESGTVNSATYANGKARIGGVFNDLSARNNLPLSSDLMNNIGKVEANAAPTQAGDAVKKWTDEILAKTKGGVLSGEAYQSIDSNIGQDMKSGGALAYHLGELRDVLRNGMDAAISPQDQAAWQTARKQYAVLKTVRDLVSKEGGDGISPQALMARINATGAGKERMAMGNGGELGTLAKIGTQFLKAAPDSGSADRILANRMIAHATNLGAVGGLVGAEQKGWISPEQAAWTGAALIGNRYGLKAANSNMAARLLPPGRISGAINSVARPMPQLLPAAMMAWRQNQGQ